MDSYLRRYLSLSFGCLLTCLLAATMLTSQYHLEVARESIHEQALAESARSLVDDEVVRGRRVLDLPLDVSSNGRWQRWILNQESYRDASGKTPPMAISSLR